MRIKQILVGALCSIAMLAVLIAPSTEADAQLGPRGQGLAVVESTQSFEATWDALIAALDANSAIRTIATVDHGAAAEKAGLSLGGNRVVFFGNPALGTPIMQADRNAGIDLPQKMQVFEQNGRVYVAYNPPSYLTSRHAVGSAPTLSKIEGALAGLARTATNGSDRNPVALVPAPGPGAGLVTTTSANDFETTWSNLIAAIDRSPASVAFTVDHGANSGGSLPPTRLVVFGNPQIGTPIMQSAPTAGVDLPLKMLVFEDEAGVTHVVSTSPGFVGSRHSVGDVPTIGGATNAIGNFTKAATTGPAGSAASDAGTTSAGAPAELAFTGTSSQAAMLAVALIAAGCSCLIATRRVR